MHDSIINFAKENIFAMVEGPKSTEVTSIDQIDQKIMEYFLAKTSVWDFYEITKEEYMNKSDVIENR